MRVGRRLTPPPGATMRKSDVVRRFALPQRLGRLIHYRLVIPLHRSSHPPEHTARGVAVGLFWAFTPLVGIQLYLVLASWLLVRKSTRFAFSLLAALAWTWVTNIFTVWPVYYVFYVTGRLFLGDWQGNFAYGAVVGKLKAIFSAGDGLLESAVMGFKVIAVDQGLPLALGCIPYAFGIGWLGYRWSLAYIRRRRNARAIRAYARRKDRQDRARLGSSGPAGG
jgi:uncharacterized protein (DUF2062 family)